MGDQPGFQLEDQAPRRYEQFVAPIMAPFVAAILEAVAPRPGEALLDLACGTGFAARAAAQQVGPSGHVVGVDVNAGMLAVASEHSAGLPAAIEWLPAPADALPFADGRFDSVVAVVGARVAELLAQQRAADGSASLPFASMLVSGTKTG